MNDMTLVKSVNCCADGKYIYLKNNMQKEWLLLRENVKVALCLYQPSSLKGRIFKKLLPYIQVFPILLKLFHFSTVNCEIDTDIICHLEKIFGGDIQLSFFLGTPSVHQKPTIQISRGQKLLGYCKVSRDNNVIDLFRSENEMLSYLKDREVKNCTESIGLYRCGDKCIFVQKTLKTTDSKSNAYLSDIHINFLKQLFEKTKRLLPYEETDYKKNLDSLALSLNCLKSEQKIIIDQAIAKVNSKFCNKNVFFCAAHRDLTPWNTYMTNNELYIFDFEYSQKTYPPYIDAFHFFTQQALLVKHKNADQIYTMFNKNRILNHITENPEVTYIAYILDIISIYVLRNPGYLSEQDDKKITQLVKLIKKLL